LKKFIVLLLCLGLVFSFAACGAKSTENEATAVSGAEISDSASGSEEANNGDSTPENKETSAAVVILKEPPVLTVEYSEGSIEALRGTYSWSYSNGDGTMTGVEADSIHPLEAKEYMPHFAASKPLEVKFHWDFAPDKISIRCWDENAWGQPASEGEEYEMLTLMLDSDPGISPSSIMEIKDGNYIFEITAEWSSSDNYSGTATYSFYTTE